MNNLENLSLTQNTSLQRLYCYKNSLTSLDLSNNKSLKDLWCFDNDIGNLELERNIGLEVLHCQKNNISNLNLNHNVELKDLNCSENELKCLNVKNGNNLRIISFNSKRNQDLDCISVDKIEYSDSIWTEVDTWSSFGLSCDQRCHVGYEDVLQSANFLVFPNPSAGVVFIETGPRNSKLMLSLINSFGQNVLDEEFETNENVKIRIEGPFGLCFLRIESLTGHSQVLKLIKE